MKSTLSVLLLIFLQGVVCGDEPDRITRLEKIADHALVPPTLNTSPLPEYDKLDYGMTIGIAVTPGGRLWACWVAWW